MTRIPDDVVEAGARELCQVQEQNGGPPWGWFPEHERSGRMAKETFRNSARACLTTALRHAEERHGAVLARVPPRAVMPSHPLVQNVQGIGWNNCRAAVRAAKWGGTDEG